MRLNGPSFPHLTIPPQKIPPLVLVDDFLIMKKKLPGTVSVFPPSFHSFFPSNQFPLRHPFHTPPLSSLGKPILVHAQPSPIVPAHRGDGANHNLLPRRPQLLRWHVHPPTETVRLKRNIIVRTTVDAMDRENKNVGLPGPIPDRIPVLADSFKLEANGRAAVLGWRDGDFQVLGEKLGVGQSFRSRMAVGSSFLRAVVAGDVLLPRHAAAIGAEELRFVGGEMPEAEFVVRHGKVVGAEVFIVRLSCAVDVTGTPAAVNQFPFAVVNLDGVPRVV